jgi:sterol desaturase/sphingolipid hydroxylase (fatty acid hydroxylase superfamily)
MQSKAHPRWNVNSLTGATALSLAACGLMGVLSLRFPFFSTPELRNLLPLGWVHFGLQLTLVMAFALSWLNLLRHGHRGHGLLAMALTLLAISIGEPTNSASVSPRYYLGLDWFVLDLFLTAAIFIPLERRFALRLEQPVVRKGFRTDLAHFFVSHVSVQATSFLAVVPVAMAFRLADVGSWQAVIAAQPLALQFLEIVLLADLIEYWVHRAFHRIPLLWRCHAIHHSSPQMDWIASSRIHLVDALLMRTLTYAPILILGFAPSAIYAYLAFVSFHAIWIHANLAWRAGRLENFLVTPHFHHWHHAGEVEAIDKNFALHFAFLDRLFGTRYAPDDRFPEHYGVEGFPELPNYFAHLVYPFRPERPARRQLEREG